MEDIEHDRLIMLFVEKIEKCKDAKEKKLLQTQLQKAMYDKIENAFKKSQS